MAEIIDFEKHRQQKIAMRRGAVILMMRRLLDEGRLTTPTLRDAIKDLQKYREGGDSIERI